MLSKKGYLINKDKVDLQIINKIKNELTVEPFKFGVNFGGPKTENLFFKVYREDEKYLYLPKYYGIEKFGKPKKNKESNGEIVDLQFKGSLREEQKSIMDKVVPILEETDGGLICLGCGQGKTVLSLCIASHFKVKTLVIVHKSFLLNQWKERIEQFTNASVGIIQRDTVDIEGKQIVIGMIQSIAKEKYDLEVFKDFGLVIFDEAHHAPSKYFSRALPLICSKKTLALSATPKRGDRLEKVLFWYFGPVIFKNEQEENKIVLAKIYKYTIEHEKFIEKKQRFTGEVNRPGTISNIVTIGRRNKFIIDLVEEILQEENRKILILSERVEHLELLKKRLDERELGTSGLYIGGMKQAKLDDSSKCTIIFGTFQMASEALDIKGLNTLVMATPRREIEQTVGRITRDPNTTIRPLIIDITDNLDSFVKQGYYRRNFYKKNSFQVIYSEVENNEIKFQQNVCEVKENNEPQLDFIDD